MAVVANYHIETSGVTGLEFRRGAAKGQQSEKLYDCHSYLVRKCWRDRKWCVGVDDAAAAVFGSLGYLADWVSNSIHY